MSQDALTIHLLRMVLGGMILSAVLFGMFALVTVRKLWKDPQTRSQLGTAVFPGGQLMNVAGALTMPRVYTRWGRRGPVGDLFADCDAVYAHTNLFDRCLGRVCFAVFWATGVAFPALMLLHYLG